MFKPEEQKLANKVLANASKRIADNDFMDEREKEEIKKMLSNINKKILDCNDKEVLPVEILPKSMSISYNGNLPVTYLIKN